MLASDPGVFKLLLEHGADPNAKNYKGIFQILFDILQQIISISILMIPILML